MENIDERALLRQFNPKKSLAQNFLTDEVHLNAIARSANLAKTDTVLEIGPGLGVLTKYLAAEAGRVVAVELDDRLIEFLKYRFSDQPHVSIVHSDILKTDISSLLNAADISTMATSNPIHAEQSGVFKKSSAEENSTKISYKAVANIPYYITSKVLRFLLEADLSPTVAVLLMQKEVAQRICATPGNLSVLAVSVQFYAEAEIVHHIPATAFYPQPKVDSAVLRLNVLPSPAVEGVDPKQFFRVVKAGFSQKRKQLLNSISAGLQLAKVDAVTALDQAQIDPKRRAETLTIAEWGNLCRVLTEAEIV